LIVHLVVWDHLWGILKVPKVPSGVPLALPLGRKRWVFNSPRWHHLFHKSFWKKIEFENFHPRFISRWRWRLQTTWNFLHEGKGNQKLGQHRSLQIFQIIIDIQDLPSAWVGGRAFTTPQWHRVMFSKQNFG